MYVQYICALNHVFYEYESMSYITTITKSSHAHTFTSTFTFTVITKLFFYTTGCDRGLSVSEEDTRNLSTQNVVDSTTVTSLNQLSEVYDRLCVVSFIVLEVYKLLYTTYSKYVVRM